MVPKILWWKLDMEQNRNCLTNCAAGSREEKEVRSRMANERRTCFKEAGSSYRADYVLTQPASFPAAPTKSFLREIVSMNMFLGMVDLPLPSFATRIDECEEYDL